MSCDGADSSFQPLCEMLRLCAAHFRGDIFGCGDESVCFRILVQKLELCIGNIIVDQLVVFEPLQSVLKQACPGSLGMGLFGRCIEAGGDRHAGADHDDSVTFPNGFFECAFVVWFGVHWLDYPSCRLCSSMFRNRSVRRLSAESSFLLWLKKTSILNSLDIFRCY